jgi:hypothetical protein
MVAVTPRHSNSLETAPDVTAGTRGLGVSVPRR